MSGRLPEEELFGEAELRRALRLDAKELPPRLDPAALIARAAVSRAGGGPLVSAVVTAIAASLLGLAGMVAASTVLPSLLSDAYAAALGVVASLAVPLAAALEAAQQPTIPIAALAAVSLAIAYEYAQRRERAHAVHTT